MAVDHNNPQSRDEEILIATIDGTEYNKLPQSRMEELLLELKEVIEESGGGGTSDYTRLQNLPKINNVTLTGDMTAEDLSLVLAEVGKGLSTNDYSDAEKAKVANLVTSIQSILDGTDIDSFGDVEIALLDKADISDLGTAAAKDSTNAVTAGSTDLVESGAVKDAIDTAVSSAYHHAGTKTVAQLTHDLLIAANEGNVYNITDSGTTTSDFIEGIGKTIDEGSNVGICKVGNVYMFDLLSGFVDTSNFVQKSETAGLLNNDGTVNTTIEGDVDDLQEWTSADTKSVTGNPITISDAAAVNAKALSMSVEPIQDLHGFDHPWVGGAGKNKCQPRITGTTFSGITVTPNEDGSISYVGTATTTGTIRCQEHLTIRLKAGTYTKSINTNDMQSVIQYGGEDHISDTFTLDVDTDVCLVVQIVEGVTYNSKVYPQIESGSMVTTWEPWSNICPISGLTSADILDEGKNLCDPSNLGHVNYNKDTGEVDGTTPNFTSTTDFVEVVAGKTCCISKDGINATSLCRIFFYDAQQSFIESIFGETYFVIPNNVKYIKWHTGDYQGSLTNWQMEYGSTPTAYTPYVAPHTATIIFGQTVYGGEVDFETGKVRVTHGIVDVSTLSFQLSADNRWYTSAEYGFKHVSNDVITPSIMNSFSAYSANGLYNDTTAIGFSINNVGNLAIRNGSTVDTPTGNLCYELATPTELTLTPAQLELLKGNNTITANGATISLTYQPDNLVGEVMEQVDEKVDGANAYTDSKVAALLPTYPTTDGAYVLTATVASGETVLSWESAT